MNGMLKTLKTKIISRFHKKWSKSKIEINMVENRVEIKIKDLKNCNIMLQNRDTKRRLVKKVRDEKVLFDLQDMKQLMNETRNIIFDIYFLKDYLGREIRKGIRFNALKEANTFVLPSEKVSITVYKTDKQTIALWFKGTEFILTISKLLTENEKINLVGEINSLGNKKFHEVYLKCQRRDNKSDSRKIPLRLTEDSNGFQFSAEVQSFIFFGEGLLNTRWDVNAIFLDEQGNIIQNDLVDMTNYKDFSKEEDRYIAKVSNGDAVLSIYTTQGKNSLAIWSTDSEQFEKTFILTEGKTLYNEIIENKKIDENLFFFESYLGKSYSGNPKYIYEELLRKNIDGKFKFVWAKDENDLEIPGNPKQVTRGSEEYFEYLGMAKYWINNIVFPVYTKRDAVVYLQTWHGTPLKKIGFDIDITGPEVLGRENFFLESRNWDMLLSANNYSTKIFKRAFKFEKEVLELGYPANDVFYNENVDLQKIRHKLSMPENRKILLYAPTWRDNSASKSWSYSHELNFDIQELFKGIGDEYIVLLRLHHLVSADLEIPLKYKDFLINCSDYDDIQELYLISDICVTDYSSVFFDFAHSSKPILFYAPDNKEYRDEIRGFYLSMEQDLPGPLIENTSDLVNAIVKIDEIQKIYENKYVWFKGKYCSLGSLGDSSEKTVEKLLQEGKNKK